MPKLQSAASPETHFAQPNPLPTGQGTAPVGHLDAPTAEQLRALAGMPGATSTSARGSRTRATGSIILQPHAAETHLMLSAGDVGRKVEVDGKAIHPNGIGDHTCF